MTALAGRIVWEKDDLEFEDLSVLGGRGSGNYGHSGRPGEKGGSGSGAPIEHQPKGHLRAVKDKAFNGTAVSQETQLSKLETGAVGEAVVIQYLKDKGFKDARTLNIQRNNFPLDLVEDHAVYEVKTGLVSNSSSAQQWRATIGQPGVRERAWLAKASDSAKARWNERKSAEILQRKTDAVKEVSQRLGRTVKGKTVGVILDPDRRIADVHVFKGFHLRIGWKSDEAKKGYVGSFKY